MVPKPGVGTRLKLVAERVVSRSASVKSPAIEYFYLLCV
jgi:hypothetical protein